MAKLAAKPKTRRRGRAIVWALATLGYLSSVTADVLEVAGQVWKRIAPVAGRELWDARPISNDPKTELGSDLPPSRYRYNPDLARYVAPNGKTVKPAAVKQQVATFNERAADEMRAQAVRMVSGQITVGEWQQNAAPFVRSVHVASYVVGRGGVLQVKPGDIQTMTDIVRFQIEKLAAFADSVDPESITALKPVSDGQAPARAAQYATAANGTFEAGNGGAWTVIAQTGVRVEARNVMAIGAEHCEADGVRPGCQEETARGWVPRDAMSLPGTRSCSTGCACRIEYRRVG